MIDETHTISAGPGRDDRPRGLEPDVLVIGKSIGGGVPCGGYGLSGGGRAVARHGAWGGRHHRRGRGGWDAGRQRPVDWPPMRATLGEVLTDGRSLR